MRVVDAGALAEAVSPEAAQRFAHFAVRSAARCAYALDGGDGIEQRADVVLLLADSAEDAYGAMTCRSSSTESAAVGGETRVERGDGLHFHCWQGRSYVHLWSAGSSAEAEAEMLKLLRYIAGHIPREDGPELLQAMPRDPENPGRRWFLRHLDSLSPGALGLSPAPDLAMNSRLLGLSPGTEMCIVSYDVPEGRRPNVVWLIRYPSAAAAAAAFARFASYLPRAQAPSWASTNLMRPHGPFLIGTWTAEEESLQYMMPRIRQLLPS